MAYVSTIERMGRQEGYAQGISQGILRGKQEGLQEGEALLLGRLLTRKFGPLPTHYRKLVAEANTDTLLKWSDRIFLAETLEEIFK